MSDPLVLTLVYNPIGPSLPPNQEQLEEAYRRELRARYGLPLIDEAREFRSVEIEGWWTESTPP